MYPGVSFHVPSGGASPAHAFHLCLTTHLLEDVVGGWWRLCCFAAFDGGNHILFCSIPRLLGYGEAHDMLGFSVVLVGRNDWVVMFGVDLCLGATLQIARGILSGSPPF